MKRSGYKAIVFDLDGTIVDTETVNQLALQKLLRDELGREYSLAELSKVCGVPGKKGLEMLGVAEPEEFMEKWIANAALWRNQVALYPGIESTIEFLQENGAMLGIVTSRTKAQLAAEPLVEHLVQKMNFVVCADDTLQHKPNPEPLLKFLELSGAAYDQALYIGDTVHDFNCASGAKVDFALAVWGAQLKDLKGPQYHLQNPQEIIDLYKAAV